MKLEILSKKYCLDVFASDFGFLRILVFSEKPGSIYIAATGLFANDSKDIADFIPLLNNLWEEERPFSNFIVAGCTPDHARNLALAILECVPEYMCLERVFLYSYPQCQFYNLEEGIKRLICR